MNYELAQELKDAGFPNIKDLQHRQGREFILPYGNVPVYSLGDAQNVKDWFIPILEELIEACGEKFDRLVAYHNKGAWNATSEKDSLLQKCERQNSRRSCSPLVACLTPYEQA
jgi:hypothetical protein